MDGLTHALGEFVAGIELAAIPAPALDTVKRGAIDCLGVMLAGRDEPAARILRGFVRPGRARGEARVLLDRGRARAEDAALVNASAAHALDYDDTGLAGHPSAVLVPAVLAEGERTGAGGGDLVAAYVAGYETWAELLGRDEDRHHVKGWHPSAVFGCLAAAAAAARLARLDAAQAAHALGIAASMAAGVVSNFGSMTKPVQVGRAAQSGIVAARLAAAGLGAAHDALEHRAGLLQAVSPAGRVRLDGELAAGREWHILRQGLNVKRYPVCYALHRAIDAVLELAARHDLRPEAVSEVEVRIGRAQAGMLRHSRPRSALEAKFSAEFAMACALIARRVGLAELRDRFVRSAPVQALLARVRVTPLDEVDAEEALFAPADSVVLRLAGGATLESAPVRRALGHAHNPIGLDALRAKFDDCAAAALAPEARAALFERLLRLDSLPGAAALYGPAARP